MKKRVHEIAQLYNISNKECLKILNDELKLNISSHLAGIEEEKIKKIDDYFENRYVQQNDENKKIKFVIIHSKKNIEKEIKEVLKEIFEEIIIEENLKNYLGLEFIFEIENIRIQFLNARLNKKNKFCLNVVITVNNKDEVEIEKLKLKLKNELLKKLEEKECYWAEDYQVENLSKNLYLELHRAENLMRSFLVLITSNLIAEEGWSNYLEKKSKSSKKNNNDFFNVNQDIYNLNVGDIFEIFNFCEKEIELNVDTNYRLDNLYKFLENKKNDFMEKENEIKLFINDLHKKAKTKISLWEKIFEEFFPENFKNKWNNLKNIRNDVMHNKLIQITEYNKKIIVIKGIKKDILKAIEVYEDTLISEKEKYKIEKIKKYEPMKILLESQHSIPKKRTAK